MAKLGVTTTVVGNVVSPSIADFSSRGPNSVAPSILKVKLKCTTKIFKIKSKILGKNEN